jgi:threonine synthase
MQFCSTRLNAKKLSFLDIVIEGLATDGGLYVPEFIPQFCDNEIAEMSKMSYQELFFTVTKPFIDGEITDDEYRNIISKSYQKFNNQAIAPLKQIDNNRFLLELFHGPTLAFKDFALQFLGNLLDYILQKKKQQIVIIGATSGDTGSAAINGCKDCKNVKIFILHPHNKVSAIQRKQMTTLSSENVFNIALEGNFDDCQSLVKRMFVNQDFLAGKKMVAVNSINFARIMAQIVYYFYSALKIGVDSNRNVSFIVPTGNFGDIYAGFLAKKMGLNINKLVIATNSNDILHRFISNNDYSKKQMVNTISPSMNIQVSSNFERMLFDFYNKEKMAHKFPQLMHEFERTGSLKVEDKILKNILEHFDSFACNDQLTKQKIDEIYQKNNEIIDPHTATAFVASDYFINNIEYQKEPVIILATAHPAKFNENVRSEIVPEPELPKFIANIHNLTEKFDVIDNNFLQITNYIASKCQ